MVWSGWIPSRYNGLHQHKHLYAEIMTTISQHASKPPKTIKSFMVCVEMRIYGVCFRIKESINHSYPMSTNIGPSTTIKPLIEASNLQICLCEFWSLLGTKAFHVFFDLLVQLTLHPFNDGVEKKHRINSLRPWCNLGLTNIRWSVFAEIVIEHSIDMHRKKMQWS